MDRLRLHLKKETDDSYDILLESGFFKKIPKDLKDNPFGNKYAVVTDSTVKTMYGNDLVADLKEEGLTACLIDFPTGETSKNLKTIAYLIHKFITEGLDRKSAILALGGGVVGDIAGFAASIYMRGIPYLQVPTTLMAQVDSSVGGKTAVDTQEGKNLIGSFYQPQKVYIDPTLLSTLPEREFKNGLAEIIKYGVIYDAQFFCYLEENSDAINKLNIEQLTRIILRSCQIKSEIVAQDEKEENLRSILNYGHTFGHAEEQCGKFKKRLHGEAVAIGMNVAGHLAVKMGIWNDEDLQRQNLLINSFGLPLQSEFQPKALLKAMYHDKKAEGGQILFVLPETIGQMATIGDKYKIPVSSEKLRLTLQELASKNAK